MKQLTVNTATPTGRKRGYARRITGIDRTWWVECFYSGPIWCLVVSYAKMNSCSLFLLTSLGWHGKSASAFESVWMLNVTSVSDGCGFLLALSHPYLKVLNLLAQWSFSGAIAYFTGCTWQVSCYTILCWTHSIPFVQMLTWDSMQTIHISAVHADSESKRCLLPVDSRLEVRRTNETNLLDRD